MIQPIHKLLDNVGRYTLFFFLILFTAPLGADDVISGKLDDERRRSSASSVSVPLATFNGASKTVNIPVGEITPSGSASNHENNVRAASNIDNHSQPGFLAALDQQPPQVFWYQQNKNEHARAELDRCGGVVSHWGEKESQANGIQWIGTVVSQTGPPSFPESYSSFLTGHDSDSRLPQVAEIKIPGLLPEKFYFEIHRKIASVRTPTGPPARFKNYFSIPNYPAESAFDPFLRNRQLSTRYTNIFTQHASLAARGSYALEHLT
jgi:hypothetical protein